MPLVPYEPFRPFDHLRRELDQFFTRDFPFVKDWSHGFGFGQLHVDVYETENEIVAECNLPGLEKKEDVHIDVDRQTLTISGTIQRSNEVKNDQMHRQERFLGRFHRAIGLPHPVSPDNVKASYKNGVLEVRMQKQQGEDKRRIDVQFH